MVEERDEKPIVNNIVSSEQLKALPLNWGIRKGCSYATVFKLCAVTSRKRNYTIKRNKDKQIVQEKLPLHRWYDPTYGTS